jgi:hypothetical protein
LKRKRKRVVKVLNDRLYSKAFNTTNDAARLKAMNVRQALISTKAGTINRFVSQVNAAFDRG